MLLRRISTPNHTHDLASRMDRLFNSIFSDLDFTAPRAFAAQAFPALNVWEDDTAMFVEAELPGVKIENVEITFQNGELTISGSHTWSSPEGASLVRQERGQGQFTRTIGVPFEIDENTIEATLTNGVLTVHLPKSEKAKSRRIPVRASASN